jgi:uncharacterized protein (TIGR02145 family)
MKRNSRINALLLITIFLTEIIFLTSCRKDPVPATLTTVTATNITTISATAGGNITADGGAAISARGVCWGTSSQPSVSGSHTSDNTGSGSFTSNITDLAPGTKYYIRAFATNKAGTAYGNELTFETLPLVIPAVNTSEVTGLTSTSAVSGGNITYDGGSPVTARGICWATTANPTTSNNKTSNGTGDGSFTANITGLTAGTTYHVRAYAINNIGTAYGNDIPFTTTATTPVLTTALITSPTRTTAVSGGNITSNGGAAVTARGVCWSTASGPVATGFHTSDGTGNGTFTSNLTDLTPNTFYYVRAYATNSAGTAYGNEVTFTTSPVQIPALTTTVVTSPALTTAVSGGNITSDNGGAVTARGVCWNTTGNPTVAGSKTSDGTGSGTFTSNIGGLTAGTVYYVRAYATNSAGTGYGNQERFSTSISDIDGNIYKTVLIGTQLWMQANLSTTKFNNNASIPNVTDNNEWKDLATPAYCWFINTPSYGVTYGAIYNWYAVETGLLCPSGWHVPTDPEFKTLEMYLGMTQAAADSGGWRGTDQGARLKSTTTWIPSGYATNSSGFTALGGGYRFGMDGGFNDLNGVSYWWSSTLHWDDTTKALYRRLDSNQRRIFREGVIKAGGKYVRCLKN